MIYKKDKSPLDPKERALCLRCLKAQITCYCGEIRRIRTRLQLAILQHPLERRNAIGTARMAHLCIDNSRLISGREFNDNPEVNCLIADPENYCVVLYPGPHAVNIGSDNPRKAQDWVCVFRILSGRS